MRSVIKCQVLACTSVLLLLGAGCSSCDEVAGADNEGADANVAPDSDEYYGQNTACDRGLLEATGGIEPGAPPASVVTGETENSSMIALFNERIEFSLSSEVSVDASSPGTYSNESDLSPSTIAEGTSICSYYLHFDPVGEDLASSSGTVSFPGNILGVIALKETLLDSHAVLHTQDLPTIYPDAATAEGTFDGMEVASAKDTFVISADAKTLDVTFRADTASDAARVLVEVPQ